MRILIFTIVVCAAVFSGCTGQCGNEISQTIVSPSGLVKAVVFSRDCGATTGFSTQVSILKSGRDLPNDGGNVLVLDDLVPLVLEWSTDSSLRVSGLNRHKIFKQSTHVSGVTVSYAD